MDIAVVRNHSVQSYNTKQHINVETENAIRLVIASTFL